MNPIDDMTSALPDRDAQLVQEALSEIAGLAHTPAPVASAEVLDLIGGGVRRRIIRRRVIVAAAAGVLAVGGTSVAAATNSLPPKAQEAIAKFADNHLPFTVPHPKDGTSSSKPVKPINPPRDAPTLVPKKPNEPTPAPTDTAESARELDQKPSNTRISEPATQAGAANPAPAATAQADNNQSAPAEPGQASASAPAAQAKADNNQSAPAEPGQADPSQVPQQSEDAQRQDEAVEAPIAR